MGMSRKRIIWLVAPLLLGFVAVGIYAARIWYVYNHDSGLKKQVVDEAYRRGKSVDITKLREHVYLLRGAGGNITALVGSDGILIVDSDHAWMADKVGAALRTLNDTPVRYVINTHHHGDHRGGNGYFRRRGAQIIAHANTAKHMAGSKSPPSTPDDMPTVTFEQRYRLTLNGEDIHLVHLPNAHTDGDVIVQFTKANVLATGDAFYFGSYPYLSVGTKGTIDGHLAGQQIILNLVDDDTMIVPGHGPLARRGNLVETTRRLAKVRDYIAWLKSNGVPLGLAPAFYPTHGWRADWRQQPITDRFFLSLVYKTLP